MDEASPLPAVINKRTTAVPLRAALARMNDRAIAEALASTQKSASTTPSVSNALPTSMENSKTASSQLNKHGSTTAALKRIQKNIQHGLDRTVIRAPKQGEKKRDAALAYASAQETIEKLQASIEISEKAYKDAITVRRTTPSNMFENQDAAANLFQENELNVNWIDRARHELTRMTARKITMNQEKISIAKSISEKTDIQLQEAKAQLQQQRKFFQARPKLLKHYYSIFGDILFVSALNDCAYAVFTTKNIIEIWITEIVDAKQKTSIKTIIELKCDPITLVHQLSSELINTSYQEHEAKGTVSSTTQKFNTSNKQEPSSQKLRNSQTADSTALPSFKSSLNNPNSIPLPKNLRGHTSSFDRIDESVHKTRSVIQNLPLRKLLQMATFRSTKMANLTETGHTLSPENLKLINGPSRLVRHRTMFFVGCQSGEALNIEIIWEYDTNSEKTEFNMNVLAQQQISYIPISHVLYYCTEEGIPLLVVEVATLTGEHVLKAFQTNFELEWACKCDVLKLASVDRIPRTILQDKFDFTGTPLNDFKNVEELVVANMCEDKRYPGIIVALQTGVLLRVKYGRETQVRSVNTPEYHESDYSSKIQDSNALNLNSAGLYSNQADEDVQDQLDHYEVNVSWVLDIFLSQVEEGFKQKSSWVDNLLPTSDHVDTTSPKNENRVRARTLMSTSPKDFKHNKAQFMVAGNDGIIRFYPDEPNRNSNGVKPISKFSINTEIRIFDGKVQISADQKYKSLNSPQIDNVLWYKNMQLGLAFTENSTLAVYDINDPLSNMAQVKIVSKKIGVIEEPKPNKSLISTPRGVYMIDDERGLGILYCGQEWSMFSISDMIELTSTSE
ncbi:hypothetical protein BDV3_000304 [Batrachochytrium dendrobatidis]